MVRTSQLGPPVVVFGDGGMAQIGFFNWAKAGLFDLDFAQARKEKTMGRANPRKSRPCCTR